MYMVLHKKDLDLDYINNTHLHTHFYISQAHLYKWTNPPYIEVFTCLSLTLYLSCVTRLILHMQVGFTKVKHYKVMNEELCTPTFSPSKLGMNDPLQIFQNQALRGSSLKGDTCRNELQSSILP